jgi:hypothetical protein
LKVESFFVQIHKESIEIAMTSAQFFGDSAGDIDLLCLSRYGMIGESYNEDGREQNNRSRRTKSDIYACKDPPPTPDGGRGRISVIDHHILAGIRSSPASHSLLVESQLQGPRQRRTFDQKARLVKVCVEIYWGIKRGAQLF